MYYGFHQHTIDSFWHQWLLVTFRECDVRIESYTFGIYFLCLDPKLNFSHAQKCLCVYVFYSNNTPGNNQTNKRANLSTMSFILFMIISISSFHKLQKYMKYFYNGIITLQWQHISTQSKFTSMNIIEYSRNKHFAYQFMDFFTWFNVPSEWPDNNFPGVLNFCFCL